MRITREMIEKKIKINDLFLETIDDEFHSFNFTNNYYQYNETKYLICFRIDTLEFGQEVELGLCELDQITNTKITKRLSIDFYSLDEENEILQQVEILKKKIKLLTMFNK